MLSLFSIVWARIKSHNSKTKRKTNEVPATATTTNKHEMFALRKWEWHNNGIKQHQPQHHVPIQSKTTTFENKVFLFICTYQFLPMSVCVYFHVVCFLFSVRLRLVFASHSLFIVLRLFHHLLFLLLFGLCENLSWVRSDADVIRCFHFSRLLFKLNFIFRSLFSFLFLTLFLFSFQIMPLSLCTTKLTFKSKKKEVGGEEAANSEPKERAK